MIHRYSPYMIHSFPSTVHVTPLFYPPDPHNPLGPSLFTGFLGLVHYLFGSMPNMTIDVITIASNLRELIKLPCLNHGCNMLYTSLLYQSFNTRALSRV